MWCHLASGASSDSRELAILELRQPLGGERGASHIAGETLKALAIAGGNRNVCVKAQSAALAQRGGGISPESEPTRSGRTPTYSTLSPARIRSFLRYDSIASDEPVGTQPSL